MKSHNFASLQRIVEHAVGGLTKVRVGMREVPKNEGTGRHFSSVDNVSSKLFERVSGDDNLTVDNKVVPLPKKKPEAEEGPFLAVDNVSSQIFDRMHAIEKPSEAAGLPEATPPGWVLVRADDLGDAPVAKFEVHDAAPEPKEQPTREKPIPNPNIADVGYRAAQRRSQLPDGAEPLEGAPVQVDEDNMLASIRELMVEQKRDFNKKAFPELEPVETLEETLQDPNLDENNHAELEHYEDVPPNRLQAAVVKFVRADTVLAICLSIWVSLLMMIFIDPELSQALAMVSLILLVIYRLMQPVRKKRRVIKVSKRRASQYDLALEDALLCQET